MEKEKKFYVAFVDMMNGKEGEESYFYLLDNGKLIDLNMKLNNTDLDYINLKKFSTANEAMAYVENYFGLFLGEQYFRLVILYKFNFQQQIYDGFKRAPESKEENDSSNEDLY